MELLTKAFKTELLEALYDLEINSEDFDHQIEDVSTTYAKHTYNIETKSLNIKIELEEEVLWQSYDYHDFQDLKVTELVVDNHRGIIDTESISDKELENNLRY